MPPLFSACPEWRRRGPAPQAASAKSRGCRARKGDSRCGARTAENPRVSRSTIRTSEVLDVTRHSRARGLVRQLPMSGTHVLLYMVDAGGGRDRAGDCGVRTDELEDKLSPALAPDLLRPT